jgi:phospholipid-translocating ATPase
MIVGDVVKVLNNEEIPCDMILLAVDSPLSNSQCFITTANLDGESNLKVHFALVANVVLTRMQNRPSQASYCTGDRGRFT